MTKKLRIGIIGCGGIAHAHARAYAAFDDVEVVAGADIISGKARAFLDEFGWNDADAYDTCEELCAREDIDAVSVCTYNMQHEVCTVAALKAGKHVLLEKPLCVTMEEAKRIVAAEKESGKILTVGFQPRYGANMKQVKQIIEEGTLGDVYYIAVGGGRFRGIPGRTFIEKDKAGFGAIGDIGCYGLDFALNSIGYPKPLTVSATSSAHFGKNPELYAEAHRFTVDDDFASAFIRLEGGVTLDWRVSWAMHMDTLGDFLFLGTKAGLKIKGNPGMCWDGTAGELTLFYNDEKGNPTSKPIPPAVEEKSNLFNQKVRSFIDAILEGKPAPIPTSQIIYNQAIIDGILKSAASGHEVEIEL
ncbi:MAG: Gfo/Idh/MocA family oxidoreductase [Clostridia bacterium]|nr:Gfo/Idh/MocA family oxidoreductase [Clostridia bacterium]